MSTSINLPENPTIDQEIVYGNVKYVYNGANWEAYQLTVPQREGVDGRLPIVQGLGVNTSQVMSQKAINDLLLPILTPKYGIVDINISSLISVGEAYLGSAAGSNRGDITLVPSFDSILYSVIEGYKYTIKGAKLNNIIYYTSDTIINSVTYLSESADPIIADIGTINEYTITIPTGCKKIAINLKVSDNPLGYGNLSITYLAEIGREILNDKKLTDNNLTDELKSAYDSTVEAVQNAGLLEPLSYSGETDVVSGKQIAIFDTNGYAEIYNRTGKGMITHMFFAGAAPQWNGYQNCIVTVITDGQTYFQGKLYELAAMGMDLSSTYSTRFGNSLFGKNGINNGIYLNYKIPYYTSVKVTLQQPLEYLTGQSIWFTVKNESTININISGIKIPSGSYLHCSRKANQTLTQGQQYELLNTSRNGVMLGIFLFCDSNGSNGYMEGCVRAFAGGSEIPKLISSGLEDYFLATYYFDIGAFQSENSGVTLLDLSGNKISAYRLHHNDLWSFTSGGYIVTVRNGDSKSAHMNLNDNVNNFDGYGAQNTLFGAQVLSYEW